MTLGDKIRIAKQKENDYSESQTLARKLADLAHMSSDVSTAYKLLKSTTEINDALAGKEELTSFDTTTIEDCLSRIMEGLNTGTSYYQTASKLSAETSAIKKDAEEYWKKYVDGQIQGQKNLVESLSNVLGDNPVYLGMRSLEMSIQYAKSGSNEALRSIEKYREEYVKLMSSLGLSDNVLHFLMRLNSNERISLLELDTESFTELKNSQFASKLVIKTS